MWDFLIILQRCVDCFLTIEPSSMESRLITVTWKSTLAAWPEKSIYDFYNFEWIWMLYHHKICLVSIDKDNIVWLLWLWYWPHPRALVVASCHMSPRAQYPRTSEGVPPPNNSIFWISNFISVMMIDLSMGLILWRPSLKIQRIIPFSFYLQRDKYWVFRYRILEYLLMIINNEYLVNSQRIVPFISHLSSMMDLHLMVIACSRSEKRMDEK